MNYRLKIGLEMHCEMKSNSKVFSKGLNIYNKEANRNVNELDIALPGTLPNLNMECVKKAIMAACILNCEIPEYMMFDRKNYYYPDLPKGYQITQSTYPVGINGNIDIECNDEIINISIQDIHLEEDAASLDHLDTMSLIDYNRAGVPLLECVTDPCIHSADEAVAFVNTMCRIYKYTDISDADTKKGQIRCDVNVSLEDENGNSLTPKVEVKNVNSISNIRDTILYEEKRQLEALENGNMDELVQETRRFDETTGTTIHMRSKVDAIDYKYFVEPNIPPFEITQKLIDEVIKKIPRLALERKKLYTDKYKIDKEVARVIVRDKDIADYFEKCIDVGIDPKIAGNYVIGLITSYINKEEISIKDFYLKPEYLKEIIDANVNGDISSKQAKEIFYKSLENRKRPKNYLDSDNKQITDKKVLESIIDKIIDDNPSNVIAYKNGKTNLFDYFVGMVMKETKGKASPVITKELLRKKIDK